jgi:DNA-binding protein YbaB
MTKKIRKYGRHAAGLSGDFSSALSEVTRLRAEVADARAEVAATTITIKKGPVSVTVTGENHVAEVSLDDPATTLSAAEIVEAVTTAILEAQNEIAEYAGERLSEYTALADIV